MKFKGVIKNLLGPDLYHRNIHEIDVKYLKRQGIKGLICDLDNTLLAWDSQKIKSKTKEWLFEVDKHGISICILSNSLRTRVRRIAGNLKLAAISEAFKPRKKAFKLAIDNLGLAPEKVAVIGDQLFTDIYGGNRLGLVTILVDPIANKEFISTKLIRLIEQRVKGYLKLRRSL